MTYRPLSLKRRHVLGDLYDRCNAIVDSIPVYLAGDEKELLGHVDQSLGHFADAFSFFVAEDVCKKLSANQFGYAFDYEYLSENEARSRVKLNSITLIGREPYKKPVPRGEVI